MIQVFQRVLGVLGAASTLATGLAAQHFQLPPAQAGGFVLEQGSTRVADAASGVVDNPVGNSPAGATALAVDPSDADAVYYYDGDVIRRVDFADGGDVSVWDVPGPQSGGFTNGYGESYVDALVFDAANPNRIYLLESTDNRVWRFTLLGSDRASLDPSEVPSVIFEGGLVTRPTAQGVMAQMIPYDMAINSNGVLVLAASANVSGGFGETHFYRVHTQSATSTLIGHFLGYPGPLAFDENDSLIVALPGQVLSPSMVMMNQTELVPYGEVELWSWGAATLATVFSAGAVVPGDTVNNGLLSAAHSVLRELDVDYDNDIFMGADVFLSRMSALDGKVILSMAPGFGVSNQAALDAIGLWSIDASVSASALDVGLAILGGHAIQGAAVDHQLLDGLDVASTLGNVQPVTPGALGVVYGQFEADAGQWNEAGGARTGIIYVISSVNDYLGNGSVGSFPGAITRMLPNNTFGEVASVDVQVAAQPFFGGETRNLEVRLLDANNQLIRYGSASQAALLVGVEDLLSQDAVVGGLVGISQVGDTTMGVANFEINVAYIAEGNQLSFRVPATLNGFANAVDGLETRNVRNTLLEVTNLHILAPTKLAANQAVNVAVELRNTTAQVVDVGVAATTGVALNVLDALGADAVLDGRVHVQSLGTVNGVAQFNVTPLIEGLSLRLVANAAATAAPVSEIQASSVTLDRLQVTAPTDAKAGSSFTLQVELLDQLGDRLDSGVLASTQVSISLISGPGGLSGDFSARASTGLANFSLTAANTGLYRVRVESELMSVAAQEVEILVGEAAPVDPGQMMQGGKSDDSSCSLQSKGSGGVLALIALLALFGVFTRFVSTGTSTLRSE